MPTLRWLLPSLAPAVLVAVGLYLSDKRREPPWLVVTTFVLGALAAFLSHEVVGGAARWTGLDIRSAAGDSGALLFLFAVAAPVREMAKVAASWPAYRSRHFDEPYDGVVYAGIAAMGFAAMDSAIRLRAHPTGSLWVIRAFLALPAHLFFAALWGYALGRSKQQKRPGPMFPSMWLVATIAHGLYAHFTFGRGPAALVALVPMLMVMGAIAGFAARDLANRGDRASRIPPSGDETQSRLSRPSFPPYSGPTSGPVSSARPPSLRTVRDALTRHDQPIRLRWILFGAVVTMGAMIAGLAGSVAFGHWAHVDFSIVDERDVATTGPVALLGAGLLAAFPLSGFLIARASSVPTLLEPALATAIAIVMTLVWLGLAAPVALVFALAFSPIAFALACAGAWVGRPAR